MSRWVCMCLPAGLAALLLDENHTNGCSLTIGKLEVWRWPLQYFRTIYYSVTSMFCRGNTGCCCRYFVDVRSVCYTSIYSHLASLGDAPASLQLTVHHAQQLITEDCEDALHIAALCQQCAFVKNVESIMESCFPSLLLMCIHSFAFKDLCTINPSDKHGHPRVL